VKSAGSPLNPLKFKRMEVFEELAIADYADTLENGKRRLGMACAT
jgi:hypothetical protein